MVSYNLSLITKGWGETLDLIKSFNLSLSAREQVFKATSPDLPSYPNQGWEWGGWRASLLTACHASFMPLGCSPDDAGGQCLNEVLFPVALCEGASSTHVWECAYVCLCVYEDRDYANMNEKPFLCRIWETLQDAHESPWYRHVCTGSDTRSDLRMTLQIFFACSLSGCRQAMHHLCAHTCMSVMGESLSSCNYQPHLGSIPLHSCFLKIFRID